MTNDTDEKQVENVEEPTSTASPAENQGTEEAKAKTEAPEQSDRAKSRQHELAQKLEKSEEENKQLRGELAGFKPEPPTVDPNLPFLPKDKPPAGVRELTQTEFDQEVDRRANQKVDLKVGQLEQKIARRDQRLNDIDEIERKYPELKPGDGQNKKLTAKVIGLVKKATDKNPDLNVLEYVDNIMDLREAGQSEGREKASAEMAKNEAEAPITPDAPTAKKATTDEQLQEKLASGEMTAAEARKYLASED